MSSAYLCVAAVVLLGGLMYSVPVRAEFLSSHGTACCPPIPLIPQSERMTLGEEDPIQPMVRVAYLIPTNRVAQPDAVQRIRWVMRLSQDWYRDQLARYGYGAHTFVLEKEEDGITPRVHVLQSAQTDVYFRGDGNQLTTWSRVLEDVGGVIPVWSAGQVWLIIPESHLQAANGSVSGGVALGASNGSGLDAGVAMVGGDALARFRPEFLTNTAAYAGQIIPEVGSFPLVQDSSFPSFEGSTFSSISSAIIGALIHELGHAFGLPHDFRNDANFYGNLMGNGCRGIRGSFFPGTFTNDFVTLNAAMTRALSVSRYFGSPADDAESPAVNVLTSSPVSPVAGKVTIEFEASDDVGLAAAWLERDGDLVADLMLEGTNHLAALSTTSFAAGLTNSYRLKVWDLSGNRRTIDLPLLVSSGVAGPSPSLRVVNAAGFPNRNVTLNASASSIPQGGAGVTYTFIATGPETLTWGPQSAAEIDVTFPEPDNYRVAVVVTDQLGNSATSMAVAVVNHQPAIMLAAASDSDFMSSGFQEPAVLSKIESPVSVRSVMGIPGTHATGIVLDRAESWANGDPDGWFASVGTGFLETRNEFLSVIDESLAVTFPDAPSLLGVQAHDITELHMIAAAGSSGDRLFGNPRVAGATHFAFEFYGEYEPTKLLLQLRRDPYGDKTEGTLYLASAAVTQGWNQVYVPLKAEGFELYDDFVGTPGFDQPHQQLFEETLEDVSMLFVSVTRNTIVIPSGTTGFSEQYRIRNLHWTAVRLGFAVSDAAYGSSALGLGSVDVESSVPWTASSDSEWVTILTASGAGDGSLNYQLAANPNLTARTATITISGAGETASFTIQQAASVPPDYLLGWSSVLGFSYRLETSDNLRDWTPPDGTGPRDGNGGVLIQGVVAEGSPMFMRLDVKLK